MNTVLNRTYRGEFLKTVASTTVPERLTSRSITSLARSGTTRRVLVTSTDHGFTPGAIVHFSGAGEAEFNVTATVAAVVDADSFYILIAGTTAAATGTLLAYADIWVRQATLLGKKGPQTINVGDVRIGTQSADGEQAYTILSDTEAYIPGREGVGPQLNLGDYYVDVATAGDGIYVLYH